MSEGKLIVSWSGGKDCAFLLHDLLESSKQEVATLVCTINGPGCLKMHGVPVDLVRLQAESLGLPLEIVDLSAWAEYPMGLEGGLRKFVDAGIRSIAYGDIFNEDVRAYRERVHRRFGLECVFPLWGRDSRAFALEFIASGYKAVVTSVDASRLDPNLAGRRFDAAFLADLPPGADPCGENGEFHTFVFEGPRFRRPIPISPSPALRITDRGRRRDYDLAICDLAPPLQPLI